MGHSKLKVLFVCNEYPPSPHGGIGVIVRAIAERLVVSGISVVVLGIDPVVSHDTTENLNGVLVARLANKYRNDVKYRLGRYFLTAEPFLVRRYLSYRLEEAISIHKPDLIESYDWSGPLWRKPSVPLVVRMHGAHTAYNYYEGKRTSRLLKFFERRNLRMADHLTAVSQHIGEVTLEALKIERPFTVIYNGVDTNRFRPHNRLETGSGLLYVGRVVPRKGLTELFKCLNYVFSQDSETTLKLAGPYEQSYAEELLALVSTQFHQRIQFLGRLSHEELPEYYSSARLVVIPSRAEAFGLTIVEAMACGSVVLATDKGSAPEIITPKSDGFLVDFQDSKLAANKILEILRNSSQEHIRKAARRKVEEFYSLDLIVREYVNFYAEVLT